MIIIPADANMYIFFFWDVGLLHGKMIDFTIFDKIREFQSVLQTYVNVTLTQPYLNVDITAMSLHTGTLFTFITAKYLMNCTLRVDNIIVSREVFDFYKCDCRTTTV